MLRRVEAVLLDTPDVTGYIRRTGAELGFFATEPFTGDILVSLKPPGQRRRDGRDLRRPARTSSKSKVPELETRVRPADPGPDQRPGGRERARSRSRSSGPTWPCSASWPSRSATIVEAGRRREDVNTQRRAGQSRHRRPARQRADGPRRADGEPTWRSSSAPPSTARWPAPCPSRTASRTSACATPTPSATTATGWRSCRSAWPRPAATAGGGAAAGPGAGFVPLGPAGLDRASVRSPNELWRENQQPVITVTGRAGQAGTWAASTRELQAKLAGVEVPARLSLGTGRQLPVAAGVVRQPAAWC